MAKNPYMAVFLLAKALLVKIIPFEGVQDFKYELSRVKVPLRIT